MPKQGRNTTTIVRDVASGISEARTRHRRKARTTLRRVVELLADKYHVRRIVLIGSLAGIDRFRRMCIIMCSRRCGIWLPIWQLTTV
jgi:hypothetical protein